MKRSESFCRVLIGALCFALSFPSAAQILDGNDPPNPPIPPSPPPAPPLPPYDYPPDNPPGVDYAFPPDFPPLSNAPPDWLVNLTACPYQPIPSGYTYSPKVDNQAAYNLACGFSASNVTYNGYFMNTSASIASACTANATCTGFSIFQIAPPYYNRYTTDKWCLKISSLHTSNNTLFMPTICYGFFSRNGATSKELPPLPPSSPPQPPRPRPPRGYAVANAQTKQVVQSQPLSAPPPVNVPTVRSGTIPNGYVFPAIPNTFPAGLAGVNASAGLGPAVSGKRRNRRLAQTQFGNDPLSYKGGKLMSSIVNVYMIYIGFVPTDPLVLWFNFFVANLQSSSYFTTLTKYSNESSGHILNSVRLQANVFLSLAGTASMDGTGVSTTDVKAVVDYCMRNNLVLPNDSNGIYVVVTTNDKSLTLPRDYLRKLWLGWLLRMAQHLHVRLWLCPVHVCLQPLPPTRYLGWMCRAHPGQCVDLALWRPSD